MSRAGAKRTAILLALCSCCCATFGQGAQRLYASVSAATVYLCHEVFMDPALCRNPQLVRKWELEQKTSLLSSYYPIESGSGFVLDDEGLVLTNRHVVSTDELDEARDNAADSLTLSVEHGASAAFSVEDKRLLKRDLYAMATKGAMRFSATVGAEVVPDIATMAVAGKREPDIALLKLPKYYGRGLRLASPDRISADLVGEEVFSFGFPLEPQFNALVVSMNKGTVSAIRKSDLNIQHSASISPGNSGGPLVDSLGTVLGMNTAQIKEGNSLFFAVGADKIREFLFAHGITASSRRSELAQAATGEDRDRISVTAKLRPPSEGTNAAEATGVEGRRVSSQVAIAAEEGSVVFLDGKRFGPVPLTLTMAKSSASLSVRGPGGAYLAKLSLDPSLGGLTSFAVELEKTGSLSIAASESSARVFFDGIDLGALGAGRFDELPSGSHRVELVGQNSYCAQDLSISAGSVASIRAEIQPVGRLYIKVPSDFNTSVKSGTYSATISGSASIPNAPLGDYSLQASGGDSPIYTTSFSLKQGVEASWDPCIFGFAAFSVSPHGAQCVLGPDHSFPADEPQEALVPGTYNATLKRPGYRDQAVSFSVLAGKRTRVSAKLEELGKGAVSLSKLASPLEIKVEGIKFVGKEEADGSVLYSGIPAGVPLSLTFVSVAGQSTSIPEFKLTLGEDETRRLEIPSGRFSLPWLPAGALVEIGAELKVELKSEDGEGFLSPLLAAGDYLVNVRGGPKGTDCAIRAIVRPGETREASEYHVTQLGYLECEKLAEERSLSRRHAQTSFGIASLVTGILGVAGTTTFYFLGKGAKADYDAVEVSADAAGSWDKVDLYNKLFIGSAIAGGIGLALSPILFSGRSFLSSRSDAQALERSIKALDEGIKALGRVKE